MKVKLEFDLPEERGESELAIHGIDYYLVLCDLDNELRQLDRYTDLGEEARGVVQKLRETLSDFLEERNLRLHE